MKNGDILWRRHKIQETLSIGQWCLSLLERRHLGTSHTSPSVSFTVQNSPQNPLLESPSAAPLDGLESHQLSEISSLLKVSLVFGKVRSHRAPNLGWWEMSHQGHVMFHQKTEQAHPCDEAVNHQFSCPQTWLFLSYCISEPTKNTEVVLLINWAGGTTHDGQHLPNLKSQLTWSWSCCNLAAPSSGVEDQMTSTGTTGPLFPDYSHRPTIHLWLGPSWGNLVRW